MKARELWRSKPHTAYRTSSLRTLNPFPFWIWLLFEPRDFWIGVYWDTPDVSWKYALDVYVCIVPLLPIKIAVRSNGFAAYKHSVRRFIGERFANDVD